MSELETDSVFVLCEQYKALPRADRVWEAVRRFSAQQCAPMSASDGTQASIDLFATMPQPAGSVGGPPRTLLCPPDRLPACFVRVDSPEEGADVDLPAPLTTPLHFGSRSKLVTLYRDYLVTIVCDLQPSIGALDSPTMTFGFDKMLDTLEKTVVALSAPCTFTVSGVTWRVCRSSRHHLSLSSCFFSHVSVCVFHVEIVLSEHSVECNCYWRVCRSYGSANPVHIVVLC